MKDKNGKPLIVKKSVFLECVNSTYENESDNYILTLSNALMIIYKHRKENSIDFNSYKGVVQL